MTDDLSESLAAASAEAAAQVREFRLAVRRAEKTEFWSHPDVVESDAAAEGWYGDRPEEQA